MVMTLLFSFFSLARGFCPAGFDDGGFPAEWQVPEWPTDLPQEIAAKHRVLTFSGFIAPALNDAYLEGPTDDFMVQGQKTFWNANGEYFLYYCERFRKWRIAGTAGWADNMGGGCFAYASDSKADRNVLNASADLAVGWIEVDGGEWKLREEAGVESIGLLGDYMPGMYEAPKEQDDATCDTDSVIPGVEGGKKKDSACPVMPAVRKARDMASNASKKAARWAMRWVRRLFPLLTAPEETSDSSAKQAEEEADDSGDA